MLGVSYALQSGVEGSVLGREARSGRLSGASERHSSMVRGTGAPWGRYELRSLDRYVRSRRRPWPLSGN